MRNNKGQVLIETAIILPILLMLIFGIIDFGLAMFMQNVLTNVAGTGARMAAVTASLTPDTSNGLLNDSKTDIATTIKSNLINGVPFSFYKNKIANSVYYKLEILDKNSDQPIKGPVKTDNMVRVTLSWLDFPTITPFYKITGSTQSGTNSLTLTGVASMRYE